MSMHELEGIRKKLEELERSRRRDRRLGLAGLLTGLVFVAAAWAPLTAEATGQSVAAVLAEAERAGLRTGFAARSVRSGEWLVRHRGDEPFLPASNQKRRISSKPARIRSLG